MADPLPSADLLLCDREEGPSKAALLGVSLLKEYLKERGFSYVEDASLGGGVKAVLLLSLKRRGRVKDLVKKGVPILSLPFLDPANFKGKKGELSLRSPKALEGVWKVLVETGGQRDFLIEEGVECQVETTLFTRPVDQRVETPKEERKAFARYFRLRRNQTALLVLGRGEKDLAVASSLATMLPATLFVYVDTGKGRVKDRWVSEKIPNLYYELGWREELYRSSFLSIDGMINLDPVLADVAPFFDAIESGVCVLSVPAPLLSPVLAPGAGYLPIEKDPAFLYRKAVSLPEASFSDQSRIALRASLSSQKWDVLAQILERAIRG